MYHTFYGLTDLPFNLAPNPRFFYPSDGHQEALTALNDAVLTGTEVMVLTGEAGTGKTLVLQALIERLRDRVRVAYVRPWRLDAAGVAQHALRTWGSDADGSTGPDDFRRLDLFFGDQRRTGRPALLVVDAAEQASIQLLAGLRILLTSSRGALQLVLAGQPLLAERLSSPGLERLAASIALRRDLTPLWGAEIPHYILHRLDVVGSPDRHLFTREAVQAIVAACPDSPQSINVLCDTCLMTAYGTGARRVDAAIVRDVRRFIDGAPARPFRPRPYTDPVAFVPRPVIWAVRTGAIGLVAALALTVAFSARAMGWLRASPVPAGISSTLAR